jgi:hypothetical protein
LGYEIVRRAMDATLRERLRREIAPAGRLGTSRGSAAAKPSTYVSSARGFERGCRSDSNGANLPGAVWYARAAFLWRHENVKAAISEKNPDRGTGQHIAEKVHAQDNSRGRDEQGDREQYNLKVGIKQADRNSDSK